jgi:gliding motility-associated-like protein
MPLSLRKCGFLILLVISVLSTHAQCSTTINTFPYVEDFEAGAAWTTVGPPATPSGAIINDWAWGSPAKPVINSAGSGTKCWVSGGLTGSSYLNGDRGYVLSPCFDFTSIQHPFIQFLIFWESEHKYDGTNLQYSLNAGTTWTDVGAASDPTNCMNANWYNYSNITNLAAYTSAGTTYQALATSKNGWCGNIQATAGSCQGGSGSGGWLRAKHCMPYLAGQPSVQFRFTFGAGTTCNAFDGVAFDSVAIGEAAPNSADFTTTCVNTTTIHFVGTAPLCPDTFQWNFGDPGSGASNTVLGAGTLTPTHTFSAPGTYNVTFTVKGGPCNAPGSVTKTVNVISVTTHTTPVSCGGGNNGTANAIVTGNSAPYSYAWSTSPAQNGDTATGLTANTYTVTVTSTGACSATATAVVTQPTLLAHSSTTTPSICTANNGTAHIIESGGTAGYTYIWSGGLGAADSISNVAAGTYIVTITDSRSCTDTAHIIVPSGGGITVSVARYSNVSCHGANDAVVVVSAGGGTAPYTYYWGATTTTFNSQSGLAAGNYVITVTDNSGCQDTAIVTISQPPALAHTLATTTTLCGASTGTAKVTETGGTPLYSYLWSNSLGTADSIRNMSSGSYTLTVTDANGCRDTVPVTISNTGGVTASLGPVTNVTCPGGNNGSISINASNGTTPYTYHWGIATNSNSTQSGFIAGSYIITVTDNAGCLTTVSASISQPAAFSHTISTHPATCGLNNGSAQVIESGGTPNYTYAWSNSLGNADSIINVGPANYTLSITDGAGCQDIATVTVTAITPPTATTGAITNVTCYGGNDGSVTINVTGGTAPFTYHWGATTTTVNTNNTLSFGSYTVTVSDSNSCTATTLVNISQPNPITAIPTATNVTCHGGNNGSIALNVAGGNGNFTYQWTNTAQVTPTITGLTVNTYAVTVTDIKGCTKDTFATITQPTAFAITFPTIINDSCSYSAQGSATVSVTGSTPGYTYLWSNGQTTSTVTGLTPGTYKITVSDINGCKDSSTVAISSPSPIVINPSATPVSCHGDSNGTASVSVSGGTAGYTYFWSNDSTTSSMSNLHPANYAVTVTDSWRCTANSSITVIDPAMLSATSVITPQPCPSQVDGGVTLTVSGGTPAYSYAWSPAGSGPSLAGLSAGTYLFTVTDSHGCTTSDSAVVPLAAAMTLQSTVVQPLCAPSADGSISINPSGGNPGYSYSWSNSSSSSTNAQLTPGNYLLTVTDSKGCNVLDTFILAYRTHLTVDAGTNDTIDLGQSVTLTATPNINSGISYVWTPDYHLSCADCQSTDAGPVQTVTYTVHAIDTNGCKASDSVVVFVNKTYNLYIPNAFTPNGDGNNDYFQIFGDTIAWKQVEAQLFNRWGEKIFESHDIDFKWDGRYKGELQGPNVYVYVINVTFIDGHSTGVMKGSLTLIR